MNLYRRDARLKLLMLLMISGTAMFVARPPQLLALLGLTLLILLCGRVDPRQTWRQARRILGLLLMLFILQCLFNRGGEPLLAAGDLTLVTSEGLRLSTVVSLRLLIVVLTALIVLNGRTDDYLLAFTQCHMPYELAFMLMAALRFLPLLREEALDIYAATQMRGVDIAGARLGQKLRLYLNMCLPVVAGAIRRSEEMSLAMEARCFRILPQRTALRRLRFDRADRWWLAAFFLAYAGIIIAFAA
ncbi:MAG: energy-coupling factor transporter transmembrane component T [Bacillota bacterium]|nr:energy-coupling factor transporter transmembrane component T [Bacillota bacterium]